MSSFWGGQGRVLVGDSGGQEDEPCFDDEKDVVEELVSSSVDV